MNQIKSAKNTIHNMELLINKYDFELNKVRNMLYRILRESGKISVEKAYCDVDNRVEFFIDTPSGNAIIGCMEMPDGITTEMERITAIREELGL